MAVTTTIDNPFGNGANSFDAAGDPIPYSTAAAAAVRPAWRSSSGWRAYDPHRRRCTDHITRDCENIHLHFDAAPAA
jgi:hypothetical protein